MNWLKSIYFFLVFSGVMFANNYTQYVNPFIGTDGHGHTFPGVTVPFGMVQLSLDTGTEGWDWCSGYHSSDSSVIGFSHTHLSGTGAADYGDILFMPVVGKVNILPGTKENPDSGYRSRFSHDNEKAEPGYYSVFLNDYKIRVELTAAKRVGFHKYLFNEKGNSKIIIDLKYGTGWDRITKGEIQQVDKNSVQGFRFSSGWANNQQVFFYTQFSKEIVGFQILNSDKETGIITAIVEFKGKWYLFHHDSKVSGGKSWLRSKKVINLNIREDGSIETIDGSADE